MTGSKTFYRVSPFKLARSKGHRQVGKASDPSPPPHYSRSNQTRNNGKAKKPSVYTTVQEKKIGTEAD